MKKLNLTSLLLGFVGMLTLILDRKTAVTGVREGLVLCMNTLIPALFPFFILSSLIIGSLSGHSFSMFRSICRLCRIPSGAESLLAVGLLGGYPVGAANIADVQGNSSLDKESANRMAVFCNNAGPSFIFGVLGPLFPAPVWAWYLWGIQILASVIVGILIPGGTEREISIISSQRVSLSDCLNRSIKSMALVCGWVIFFRMILEFLRRWFLWLFPVPAQIILTGLLELSNGCLALSGIENESLRFLLASVMLSTGGISVWMQTKAVFPELDLNRYIAGRVLHGLTAMLLSLLVTQILDGEKMHTVLSLSLLVGCILICFTLFFRKQKKAVAF